MPFWKLKQPDLALAAVDAGGGREWTYQELRADVARIQNAFPRLGRKSLGLLIAQNRYECLAAYLAALNADTALILVDAALNSELMREFVRTYWPDWVFFGHADVVLPSEYRSSASGEVGLFENAQPRDVAVHPDLALLLNTSGSTGSPKLVRLALRNLAANASSIAEYLNLTPAERPITSLPMPYSYGLSVINSHLHAGAAVVFTDHSVLRREFWQAVDGFACTSFAGVPYTYQLLLQTGLLQKKGSSLKTLTQAGGRLDERQIEQMHALARARGFRFFVMYGQTEATARISYVPFERLGHKIGSVGVAVPGGCLQTDEQNGELIYSGPNVMLGYADCREDLALGDDLHGVLRTGDLARQDNDGYFYITGRLKRFLKLFGKRFNLDEVERVLSKRFESMVACFGRDDSLTVAVEKAAGSMAIAPEEGVKLVCQIFDLSPIAVKVISVEEIPRNVNGKIDYSRLGEAAEQCQPPRVEREPAQENVRKECSTKGAVEITQTGREFAPP